MKAAGKGVERTAMFRTVMGSGSCGGFGLIPASLKSNSLHCYYGLEGAFPLPNFVSGKGVLGASDVISGFSVEIVGTLQTESVVVQQFSSARLVVFNFFSSFLNSVFSQAFLMHVTFGDSPFERLK